MIKSESVRAEVMEQLTRGLPFVKLNQPGIRANLTERNLVDPHAASSVFSEVAIEGFQGVHGIVKSFLSA